MKNRSYLVFLGQRYERMVEGEKTKVCQNIYLTEPPLPKG